VQKIIALNLKLILVFYLIDKLIKEENLKIIYAFKAVRLLEWNNVLKMLIVLIKNLLQVNALILSNLQLVILE